MHFVDQNVVVMYTLYLLRLWNIFRFSHARALGMKSVLQIKCGIPSNSSAIFFYGDCLLFEEMRITQIIRLQLHKPLSDSYRNQQTRLCRNTLLLGRKAGGEYCRISLNCFYITLE